MDTNGVELKAASGHARFAMQVSDTPASWGADDEEDEMACCVPTGTADKRSMFKDPATGHGYSVNDNG